MMENINDSVKKSTKAKDILEPQNAETKPAVFDEVQGMDQNMAVSVLVQVADLAQKSGILSMRDSVVLAKAIDTLMPGKI